MESIAEIDLEIYKIISKNITTTDVIITKERISHINARHPGDWENYGMFAMATVTDPDFKGQRGQFFCPVGGNSEAGMLAANGRKVSGQKNRPPVPMSRNEKVVYRKQ